MIKHASYKLGRWLITLSCIAIMSVMASCGSDNEPKGPTPEPTPEPKAASRTVLVYMVATNNLGTGGFDKSDLDEMVKGAQAGDIGDGRLIAYHASSKGVVLKEITAQGIDTLKIYENNALSVSVDRMREVMADVKELAPSEEYGLILWSHATGWLQDGIEEELPSKAMRSFGSDGLSNAKKMNITSMAYALEGAGLSFIYFDCCYMGSVETLYELRKCAPYLISSPTEVPSNGMPYDLNLKHFFDKRSTLEKALVNAARSTFNDYNDVFVKGDCPCTMNVVKSDKLEALAEATAKIYKAADKTTNPEYDYQKFKVTGTCYYFDFAQYVESICDDTQMYANWNKALNDAVIYADATPYIWSKPINRHCGLSTYIVSSINGTTNNNYDTLSWYSDVASKLFKK